jgi:hypothetical protein
MLRLWADIGIQQSIGRRCGLTMDFRQDRPVKFGLGAYHPDDLFVGTSDRAEHHDTGAKPANTALTAAFTGSRTTSADGAQTWNYPNQTDHREY